MEGVFTKKELLLEKRTTKNRIKSIRKNIDCLERDLNKAEWYLYELENAIRIIY